MNHKLEALIDLLHKKQILDDEDLNRLAELQPFPQR